MYLLKFKSKHTKLKMFYILRFRLLHEYEILNQNTNEKVRISEKKRGTYQTGNTNNTW